MPLQSLFFSSPGASAGATEARRFALWWDEFRANVGGREVFIDRQRPFFAKVEYRTLGAIGLGRGRGTIKRIERRRDHIAADGVDCFVLVINRCSKRSFAQAGMRSTAVPGGGAMLFDYAAPSTNIYPDDHFWSSLRLPRRLLCDAMPSVEDAIGIPLAAENQALHLLTGFADALLVDGGLTDPVVMAQAGQSLLDLAVLAIGTNRDAAETAHHRGLRAARLSAVLRQIRLGYTDPDLSPDTVAARVGVSTRTLHALLHETDASFSERIRELRLAKAFALLCDTQGAVRTVSAAAYEAGFSDLSHFIRSFRRKYGMTPTAARRSR